MDCSARMATSVGVGPLRALTVSSFVEKTSMGSKPVALRKPFQGSHGFALPSLTSRRGKFGKSLVLHLGGPVGLSQQFKDVQ